MSAGFEDAQRAYLEILGREPSDLGALCGLAALLSAAGNLVVSRALATRATIEHPQAPQPLVALGDALRSSAEYRAAIDAYDRALALDATCAAAHFGRSVALLSTGHEEEAELARQRAFAKPIVAVAPALERDQGEPLDVLLLVSAQGGNVVVEPLLDRRWTRVYTLVVEGYAARMALPEHHLVLNAVGDADRAAAALAHAAAIARASGRPVVNHPDVVLRTGRAEIARRLRDLPGVVVPKVEQFACKGLDAATLIAAGFRFPLLVRSPGHHTGRHFLRVDEPRDLAAALASLPGEDVLTIAFFDGRDDAGDFRKYRVLFIGGRLYPLHLAISRQWKVHYFSSDMLERPEHRANEAAFLSDMPAAIGARGVAALAAIQAELGLDYGGVDFGIDPQGRVMVYEANATMVILPPPDDERFAYRGAAIAAASAAAKALLTSRGGDAENEHRGHARNVKTDCI